MCGKRCLRRIDRTEGPTRKGRATIVVFTGTPGPAPGEGATFVVLSGPRAGPRIDRATAPLDGTAHNRPLVSRVLDASCMCARAALPSPHGRVREALPSSPSIGTPGPAAEWSATDAGSAHGLTGAAPHERDGPRIDRGRLRTNGTAHGAPAPEAWDTHGWSESSEPNAARLLGNSPNGYLDRHGSMRVDQAKARSGLTEGSYGSQGLQLL